MAHRALGETFRASVTGSEIYVRGVISFMARAMERNPLMSVDDAVSSSTTVSM